MGVGAKVGFSIENAVAIGCLTRHDTTGHVGLPDSRIDNPTSQFPHLIDIIVRSKDFV